MSAAPRVAAGARRTSLKPGSKEKQLHEEAPTDKKKQKPRQACAPSMLRSELLRRGNLSLSASCASEASNDSFCSRASTGRIGRSMGPPAGAPRRRAVGSAGPPAARPPATRKAGSVVTERAVTVVGPADGGTARCPWVTPNTDPCYTAFHDQEWGVPVHDDKKLFEMLVLSSALAEMTWPAILSKREIFREVFMDFDPLMVSKLNEKKFVGPGSPARSLLSEQRLRTIIENARELLKLIEEFGSFDKYCWGFLNNKPIVGRFRYPRQVPVKTPKADAVSQDLMRRGFRGVGPTVIYSFMQAVGMANDHLITCFRFEECCSEAAAASAGSEKPKVKDQDMNKICGLVECVSLEKSRTTSVLGIS